MQGLLLIAFLPAARSMEVDIAAPPALTVRNEIDAEGYFNVTMSGGAECMCEEPACAGNQLEFNDFATFRAKERCNSYAVGGSITTHGDGTVCYTFRADYKSCVVYPSDAYTSGFTCRRCCVLTPGRGLMQAVAICRARGNGRYP